MAKVELSPVASCLRCGHAWIPRKAEILTCPKCKSPYWNRPRRQAPGTKGEDHG